MTRIGSLFSGYGGLDLAALVLFPHAHIAWHCENSTAPTRILEHHWPGVPNLGDITRVDWTTVDPVDVLTGGYPCQPFSAAGRRKGSDDDRHLWPYVRDAIRQLRPRYTLLENVAGHRSLGFDRVLGDLAEDGFDAEWTSIRASDVGAPHHRERLFILVTDPAHHGLHQFDDRPVGDAACGTGLRLTAGGDRGEAAAHPECVGLHGRGSAPQQTEGAQPTVDRLRPVDWGQYAPAVRRWERVVGPAPAPTEPNSNGKPRLSAAFAEWMMGLPAGGVTAVPGVGRAEQLAAVGNGVCPQQAHAAFTELLAVA